jgi:hypothetical protein
MGMQQAQSTQIAVTYAEVSIQPQDGNKRRDLGGWWWGWTLKIAEMAVKEARSIKPRQQQKKTLTQTAITGVLVLGQILAIYFENGNI